MVDSRIRPASYALLIVAGLLIVTGVASATPIDFTDRLIFPAAGGPQAVHVADLDGDGRFDVLVGSENDDTIGWFRNLPAADFSTRLVISTVADGPRAVSAADLDGDGDLDVLSSSLGDDKIAWYENLGAGTFGAQQVISTALIDPLTVVAADLDGDGDEDVVSTSGWVDKVVWFENDGSGSFSIAQLVSEGTRVWAIFPGDLDGDGDLDLVSAYSFQIVWQENVDGQGAFGLPRLVSTTVRDARAVWVADIDGDSDNDVVWSGQVGSTRWIENLDGLGTFGVERPVYGWGGESFVVADLDGDNDVDIALAQLHEITWHENTDGEGSYADYDVKTGDLPTAIEAGDLDGDGDFDLVSTDDGLDVVEWHEHEGTDCNDNGVADAQDIGGPTSADCNLNGVPDECDVATGLASDCNANGILDTCETFSDCNGDGVPDECAPDCNGNSTPDVCDVAGGGSTDCNGNEIPDECEPDCNGNGIVDSCDVAASGSDCNDNAIPDECEADCNGNGIPDPCDITSGASGDCDGDLVPDECEQDCNGINGPDECETAIVAVGPNPLAAETVAIETYLTTDMDGDGDPDVAIRLDREIAWYENLGSGQFLRRPGQPVGSGVSLAAADLNQDGAVDLVSCDSDGAGSTYWLANLDGDGTLSSPRPIANVGCDAVAAGDITGDGFADVVLIDTSVSYEHTVVWYESQIGAGLFGPAQLLVTNFRASEILVLDLDGDEDRDLLIGGGSTEIWIENLDGLGSFGPWEYALTDPGMFPIDLDNDGLIDILFPNDTRVAFREIVTPVSGKLEAGSWVEQVAAADFDGDGDPDVIATVSGNRILWFEHLDGLQRGLFRRHDFSPTLSSDAPGLAVADLDSSTTADVIVASDEFTLVWFSNTGGDCDGDGTPDSCEPDCDGNGIPDDCGPDCNGNGIDDACDLLDGTSEDCDGNGVPNECDSDCNGNLVSDACDVMTGTSDDCNLNGLPDECEVDCNGNLVPDSCDLTSGTSDDCNLNGAPDECDIANGSDDCALDGVPDECEPDCNGNGLADGCDIADGASGDCNANQVPDECEDCNANGLADECDIDSGTSADCDLDGEPDECATAVSFDQHVLLESTSGFEELIGADLDGDGDEDIVAASSDRILGWYENLDDSNDIGGLHWVVTKPYGDSLKTVEAADLDGDGDNDLVYAYDGQLAWAENFDGTDTFGGEQKLPGTSTSVIQIYPADLDGDGDLDILFADVVDDLVAWHENLDGAGSFGSQQFVDSVNGANSAVAVDLDGDGDLDLLSASGSDDRIYWYRNDGAGVFDPRRTVSTDIDFPSWVSVVNIDGGHGPDVVARASGNRIVWKRNLGNGNFGTTQTIADRSQLQRFALTDVRGNGRLDVVATYRSDPGIVWYENLGGTFSAEQFVATVEPDRFAPIHFDGNTVMDLISTDRFGPTQILWHESFSSDCNANGIPDSCEPDCNANEIADGCDISFGTSMDCNANLVPDECDTTCSLSCDSDSDGCLDDVDSAPSDPNSCADVDGDQCDDCSGGSFDPSGDGSDNDLDGYCDFGDCLPSFPDAWTEPSAVTELMLGRDQGGTLLTWQPTADPGALQAHYDTISGQQASDFTALANCLESGETDTTTVDGSLIGVGDIRYYLIRADNDCSGDGTLGPDSRGVPRRAIACP